MFKSLFMNKLLCLNLTCLIIVSKLRLKFSYLLNKQYKLEMFINRSIYLNTKISEIKRFWTP